MRVTILTILLVGVISTVTCDRNNELMTRLKLKYIEGYLQERQNLDILTSKIEEICPGSKLKVENAYNELKVCADQIDETAETSCSILQNRAPKCIEPVMKVMRDCLPEESKEIPDFAMKAILKAVGYICKTDGEHIFELGNTCLYKQNPITMQCRRKLGMKLRTYQKNGVGVEDICSLMQNLRPCLKSHLALSCGSPITQEAVVGVYDAFMSNCKSTDADPSSNELKKTEDIEVNQLEDFE